ncbi:hypothetical protein QBC35DRAFT_467984 [Podospora australis]|uniref:Uncharacterized protein n=1 Tax=Podospora australis TaxID=1536484 RepID=A0AAN6WI81_9PEZI|nr:hypothetical protein QBC35DRAFT_467984 [Podospora australis]
MAKFTTLLLSITALLASTAMAQRCPPNARLCGEEIANVYRCETLDRLIFITPAGNEPKNCHYRTDASGTPQGAGASCCADGQCMANGGSAFCG